jgi:hypothetical protein
MGNVQDISAFVGKASIIRCFCMFHFIIDIVAPSQI